MKFTRIFCLSLLLLTFGAHGEISGPGWFQSPIVTNLVVEEIEFSDTQGEPTQDLMRLSLPEIAEAWFGERSQTDF